MQTSSVHTPQRQPGASAVVHCSAPNRKTVRGLIHIFSSVLPHGLTGAAAHTSSRPVRWQALLLASLLGLPLHSAVADSGRAMPAQVPAAYGAECGSCHTAYAPSLLPKRSWERVMGDLTHHYGVDASLDDATVRQLATWLGQYAGTYKRVGTTPPPQDRITRSDWFVRKHDEVDASVWKLASVRSAANCAACHTDADTGRFDERRLKVPAGLPAHLARRWGD